MASTDDGGPPEQRRTSFTERFNRAMGLTGDEEPPPPELTPEEPPRITRIEQQPLYSDASPAEAGEPSAQPPQAEGAEVAQEGAYGYAGEQAYDPAQWGQPQWEQTPWDQAAQQTAWDQGQYQSDPWTQQPYQEPEAGFSLARVLGMRRARLRRTRRTLRHIDPWSVLKVSVLLYTVLYLAALVACLLLWAAIRRSGLVDDLESFIAEVGSYDAWTIDAPVIYSRAWRIGVVLAAAGVAFNVLVTVTFNLISDLVGGVRVTILEEDDRPPLA